MNIEEAEIIVNMLTEEQLEELKNLLDELIRKREINKAVCDPKTI